MPKVIKQGSSFLGQATREQPQPQRPVIPAPPLRKKPIIEREVVGATQEAIEIRQRAESEAQRIVEEAEEQAYQMRQNGFEEGRQEGLAQHTQQITQSLLRIRKMEEELEPTYVGLIRECVQRVLGLELKTSPDAIVGVVRAALSDARQQREIIVRVNPVDAEVLQKQRNRLLEMLARADSIAIREDAAVSRGGCIVVTELGTIDASLERQLDALEAALMAELAESGALPEEESELDPEDDPGAGYQY